MVLLGCWLSKMTSGTLKKLVKHIISKKINTHVDMLNKIEGHPVFETIQFFLFFKNYKLNEHNLCSLRR